MAASRRLWLALAAAACSVAGCDAILGLDSYSVVSCEVDCGADAAEEDAPLDVNFDGTAPAPEAGHEAGDGGSDSRPEGGMETGPADAPSELSLSALELLWAQWPMPYPDAATVDGAPPQWVMSYAVIDAGHGLPATVYDKVTQLTWIQEPLAASDFDAAVAACGQYDAGFHPPSRIELVTLVDFTQQPAWNKAVFGTPSGVSWTVSGPTDAGTYWSIDFSTGLATTFRPSGLSDVLCVREP